MLTEFSRLDDPETVVGRARWSGSGPVLDAEDQEVLAALRRVFRPTPLVVDDPAQRTAGTAGPVVLEPGTVRWFAAAVRTRAPAEGFAVRFVAEGGRMGWDPAGAYRPFLEMVDRLASPSPG